MYKRIYHPKLGKFVYKHKGTGLIVDNIFKPTSKIVSKAVEAVLKPLTKKVVESGIEHVEERLGKKVAEKSGDLIAKRLNSLTSSTSKAKPKVVKPKTKPKEEDFNVLLNQLISGNGMKKNKKTKKKC